MSRFDKHFDTYDTISDKLLEIHISKLTNCINEIKNHLEEWKINGGNDKFYIQQIDKIINKFERNKNG